MATIFGIPFATGGYTTDASGLLLGDRFFDAKGREWTLYAVTNDLVNNAFAANEVAYIANTNVTYPTDQTITLGDATTTVAIQATITNDVSAALRYAAGPPVVAAVAGVMDGAIGEATAATAAAIRYALCLTKGRHLIKTNGDGDISAGDLLIAGGDGTCDSVAFGATNQTDNLLMSKVGQALTADDTAGTSVYAMVAANGTFRI